RTVAAPDAVGVLGPAAVRGHDRGAGTVLPVGAGGAADNSTGRPGQQGEAEHGDDDDASNGGGHGVSPPPRYTSMLRSRCRPEGMNSMCQNSSSWMYMPCFNPSARIFFQRSSCAPVPG